jgi:hypothetical protein
MVYCVPFFYFDHCIVCLFSILTFVLCAFPLFWPLYRVPFFYFDPCIGQNRRKAHNTKVKIEGRHTIQRSKYKKDTQYNGQNRRKTHNIMVKMPFFYFDRCIVCLSSILTFVLCVFLLFWPLYCVPFFYFDLCIVCLSSAHNTMVKIEERHTIQWSKIEERHTIQWSK